MEEITVKALLAGLLVECLRADAVLFRTIEKNRRNGGKEKVKKALLAIAIIARATEEDATFFHSQTNENEKYNFVYNSD